MSEIKKCYVTSEFKTTLTCPQCKLSKQADVSKFMLLDAKPKLKCKCKCGNQFNVILERRRSIRKSVSFPGWLIYQENRYKMKVIDISKHGIKIHIYQKQSLQPGVRIDLEFTLNDPMNSTITRSVRVNKILSETRLGCEFLEHDHSGSLGKYFLFYF